MDLENRLASCFLSWHRKRSKAPYTPKFILHTFHEQISKEQEPTKEHPVRQIRDNNIIVYMIV